MLTESQRFQLRNTFQTFCDSRVPESARDQLSLEFNITGAKILLFEVRPQFQKPDNRIRIPVAQFRFDPTDGIWSLFCRDRNEKWHLYEPLASSENIGELISEVDKDRTGIFWG